MDKQTFSSWGSIVCIVLVIAIMMAFATPFSGFIADGVRDSLASFKGTTTNAMKPPYTVKLNLGNSEEGTVTFKGEYEGKTSLSLKGDVELTVEATPKPGYTFAGWYDGDTLLSTDPTYTFTANEKLNLRAEYKAPLAPGLYDANDNLVADWDTLVNTYGLNATADYNYQSYMTDPASPYYVFTNNAELSSGVKIIFGDVSSIGNLAFYHCSHLVDVELSDSITSVGERAFGYCDNLAVLTINGAKSFNEEAFYLTNNVKKVFFRGTLEQWLCNVFEDNSSNPCNKNTSLYINGELLSGEVVIPSTITKIPKLAFYNCTQITKVELHSNVTSIGRYAFSGCSSLTNINIPDSVTDLGAFAFGSTGFTNFAIPSSVTTIGDGLFSYCTNLTNVTLPSEMANIPLKMFYGCYNLVNITLPDSLTEIGQEAFRDCKRLASIVIPDNVTKIRHSVFYGCHNLTSVTLGSSVNTIETNAFSECFKLVEIINKSTFTIGDVNTNDFSGIGTYALDIHNGESKIVNQNGFLFYPYAGTNYLLGYEGTTSELSLPSSFNGQNYEMYRRAFCCFYNLTSLTVGEDSQITTIPRSAFEDCTSLVNLELPNSVTSIGGEIAYRCTNLTTVIFKGTAEQWNSIAKQEDWNEIDFGSQYILYVRCTDKVICLLGCKGGTATCTQKAVCVGCGNEYGPFAPCSVVDGKCTICGREYDSGVAGLYDSNDNILISWDDLLSQGVVHVDNGVVYTNADLDEWANSSSDILVGKLVLPNDGSITALGDFSDDEWEGRPAFMLCTQLTEVVLPDSVTIIGDYAFEECESLSTVNLPDGVISIGVSAFDCCGSLLTIEIPDGVTSISDYAFYECTSLASVEIPDGVASISDYAFNKCTSLASVELPLSVSSIGRMAFGSCSSLSTIVFAGTTEQWNSIPKGSSWNYMIQATSVTCSNGSVCAVEHSGGFATCQEKAVCDVCGFEYGELAPCTGGMANCQEKAKCATCNNEYGDLGACTPENGVCTGCGTVCTVIQTAHDPYDGDQYYVVLGTWDYSDATSVNITITYQTDWRYGRSSYDSTLITQGTDYSSGTYPSSYRNYLNSSGSVQWSGGTKTTVQFIGTEKKTVTFENLNMLTGSVIFNSNSSDNNYYGVAVTITPNY